MNGTHHSIIPGKVPPANPKQWESVVCAPQVSRFPHSGSNPCLFIVLEELDAPEAATHGTRGRDGLTVGANCWNNSSDAPRANAALPLLREVAPRVSREEATRPSTRTGADVSEPTPSMKRMRACEPNSVLIHHCVF